MLSNSLKERVGMIEFSYEDPKELFIFIKKLIVKYFNVISKEL